MIMLALLPFFCYSQEAPWVTTFEEREEMKQVVRLSNGNFLLSGRTFEIGNKSDLVILISSDGEELARKPICESCSSSGEIVFTKETANNELFHVRSNGDIFVSSLDLAETRFLYNIEESEFESIDAYQVLENNDFVIVVSSALKDGIKGLLHTSINTTTEEIGSQKFNNLFPDIAGSIGIGLFRDAGVVDGYNSIDSLTNASTAHLLRFGRFRDLIWEKSLDQGDIKLHDVMVSYDQDVYAVGTVVDEANPNHMQGIAVAYDQNGELLWEKRFDSEYLDNPDFETAHFTFSGIKAIRTNIFAITGHVGGEEDGREKTDAFVLQIDNEGNELDYYTSRLLTDESVSLDVVYTRNREVLYIANSFAENGISGSYVSIARNVASSAFVPVPSEIELYPNPVKDFLIIDDKDGNIIGMDLQIYDMNGKMVHKQKAARRLVVDHLEAGVYYLVLIEGTNKYVHRFIKS